MNQESQFLLGLKDLLLIEKAEEAERFREQFLNTPLTVRKAKGITWYPANIAGEKIGLGGRLILEVTCASARDGGGFSPGSVAVMFSMADPNRKIPPSIRGVVVAVEPGMMKFAPDDDELPDWTDEGKIGIDLSYDEKSFKHMEAALEKAAKAEKGRLAEFREIFVGGQHPRFQNLQSDFSRSKLNESQQRAVQKVLNAKDLAIIHGPPGTGKTTTLVQAVVRTMEYEKQVLVCAASNLAVDLLTEKLSEAGLKVLRLGHPARVTESVLKHSMDAQVQNHKGSEDVKQYRKEAEKIRKHALKFKRSFGPDDQRNRRSSLEEAKILRKQAMLLEEFILSDVIKKADVILCTLTGSATHYIKDLRFPVVFMDEAAQALEPSCWIALAKADKVVLAGDHCQLPPTVKSDLAAKKGLNVTLFERLVEKYEEAAVMLDTQYRMNEKIMGYSSKIFYANELKAAPAVQHHLLGTGSPELEEALEFIDTAGCGYEENFEPESMSLRNEGEAELLGKYLKELLNMLPAPSKLNPTSIGVISPYKAQVNLLRNKLRRDEDLKDWLPFLAIDTVDGFQGQEKDLIFISMVRSNEKNQIGFLSDTRRMNVGMTRARKKLVIIGDSATISGNSFFTGMLEYVEKNGKYRSGWEFVN